MRKNIKRMCLPILVMLLVCFMSMPAFASGDLPDLDWTGSITITLKNTDTGEIVSDGSLALYQVADAVKDDGNYTFEFAEAFSDCNLLLEDIESESLASDLAAYAARKGLRPVVRTVGIDGTVSFTGMKTGLYLIVQQSAAEGYQDVRPFLVSIPMQSDNKWIYDVDASPKVELIGVQFPTQPGTTGSGNIGTKLPQTGQLNWPVPALAVAGVLLFAAGWTLNNTKGSNNYEK